MSRLFVTLLFVLALLTGAASATATASDMAPDTVRNVPRILAGTATTADILRDLTDGQAEIRQLIPGGACPGHYDLRPGDLIFLEQADLLVLEAYQVNMPNMADLVRAAGNAELRTYVLPLVKDTMLPESQIKMTGLLAEELAGTFPALAGSVDRAEEERVRMVREMDAAQAARVKDLNGVAALCSSLQAGFASWAGLAVADTYGRPEDLTPDKYARLLEAGQAQGVRLVLDNKQSGPGAGAGLAETLGAGQADLTSFPGANPDEDQWAQAFTGNVDRLLRAWDTALEEGGS